MVRAFLSGTGLSSSQIDRVSYLVGHHHTLTSISGMDYQILVEADYIANASENHYGKGNIENFVQRIVKTQAGKRMISQVFGL